MQRNELVLNSFCAPICSRRCGVSHNPQGRECGMVSLLMAAILPVVFVLFAVAMDIAQMAGIRDRLQRVADESAHDALVRGLSSVDVDRNVRTRMQGSGSLAELASVDTAVAAESAELSIVGHYHGVFSQFFENLLGRTAFIVPFAVRSRVRMQRSVLLFLLDRRVTDAVDICSDRTLRSMSGFLARLRESVQTIPSLSNMVAITPGDIDVVDIISADGSDTVSRCRPPSLQTSPEVREVAGSVAPLDVWDSASGLSEAVARELFSVPFESRSVIAVVRSDLRAAGYTSLAYQFIDEIARAARMPINLYFLVVDGGGAPIQEPQPGGLYGGVYREVDVSVSELEASVLLVVLFRTVRERLVLEF